MKLPTSALAKLVKSLLGFLKFEGGEIATQLGWKGILANFKNIAKIAYNKGGADDGFGMVSKWMKGDGVAGMPMHLTPEFSLEFAARHLRLPIGRLVGEFGALLGTIGGLVAGAVFGSRFITKTVEGEQPAAVNPEVGSFDVGGRTAGAEFVVGGANAGVWSREGGHEWDSPNDMTNVRATQHDDIIRAGDGADQANIFDGAEGNDHIDGGLGNDTLIGGVGHDTLLGGEGDDVLSGGRDADTIDGGAGEDFADYSESDAGVTIDLSTGTGSGGHAEGDRLNNIEHIVGSAHNDVLLGQHGDVDNMFLGGGGDDHLEGRGGDDILHGEDGNDRLYGGDGDDVLSGGAGADILDGGAGQDTADYSASSAGVTVDLSGVRLREDGGTELQNYPERPSPQRPPVHGGDAEGDVLTGIEHLIGSDHADVLIGQNDNTANIFIGGAGDDRLEGRGGDDVLKGGAGADVIDGGEGQDVADYSGSDAGVSIDLESRFAGGGHANGDVLRGIEHLVGSDHADMLAGDNGANLIGGGAGDDRIFARSGNDVVTGGDGNDQIYGHAGNDALFGDAGADLLEGGVGDDMLSGGSGADVLDGGDGRDVASYIDSEAEIWVDLANGTGAWGDAEGDTLIGIEDVIGSKGADRLIGSAGDNVLLGEGGNDYLDGGAGADTLDGGDGTDLVVYRHSTTGVRIDLHMGTGALGDAEGDTLTNIENLILSNHHDFAFGSQGVNWIEGRDGNDEIYGLDGDDHLDGGAGADYLSGDGGNDWLEGGVGYDRLVGGTGSDRLDGGEGDDMLNGGVGDDQLDGGAGYDTFVFDGAWGADLIRDFSEEDIIALDSDSYAQLENALATATEYHGADGTSQTTLNFGNGRAIIFDNVNRGELTTDDFRVGS